MKSAVFFCALYTSSLALRRCWTELHVGLWVLEWVRVEFQKPLFNPDLKILAHASQKTKSKFNGPVCKFWKSTLCHSMTHNSASQHRIAKEVSKCLEENCASHEFIRFSHNISVFDISDNNKCKDTLCTQFIIRTIPKSD